MFKIDYKMIAVDYDQYVGENGYFILSINDQEYGEMYDVELVSIFGTEDIADKFLQLGQIIYDLERRDYVAWSNIQSYNQWLEFKRIDDNVVISLRRARKGNGTQEIEYSLDDRNPEDGLWVDEIVSYQQMKSEIINQMRTYFEYLDSHNQSDEKYLWIKAQLIEYKWLN